MKRPASLWFAIATGAARVIWSIVMLPFTPPHRTDASREAGGGEAHAEAGAGGDAPPPGRL